MTKDGIAGIVCTIVFAALFAAFGRDWLVTSMRDDPVSLLVWTAAALALGYFLHALAHHGDTAAGVVGIWHTRGSRRAPDEWATDEDIDEMFAGDLLAELAAIGDAEKRSEHVREKVASENDGFTEHRLAALERYGCVRLGYKGDVRQLGGDWIDITRADYPDYDERERMDAQRGERGTA